MTKMKLTNHILSLETLISPVHTTSFLIKKPELILRS
jgi:hypothetical protein